MEIITQEKYDSIAMELYENEKIRVRVTNMVTLNMLNNMSYIEIMEHIEETLDYWYPGYQSRWIHPGIEIYNECRQFISKFDHPLYCCG